MFVRRNRRRKPAFAVKAKLPALPELLDRWNSKYELQLQSLQARHQTAKQQARSLACLSSAPETEIDPLLTQASKDYVALSEQLRCLQIDNDEIQKSLVSCLQIASYTKACLLQSKTEMEVELECVRLEIRSQPEKFNLLAIRCRAIKKTLVQLSLTVSALEDCRWDQVRPFLVAMRPYNSYNLRNYIETALGTDPAWPSGNLRSLEDLQSRLNALTRPI